METHGELMEPIRNSSRACSPSRWSNEMQFPTHNCLREIFHLQYRNKQMTLHSLETKFMVFSIAVSLSICNDVSFVYNTLLHKFIEQSMKTLFHFFILTVRSFERDRTKTCIHQDITQSFPTDTRKPHICTISN